MRRKRLKHCAYILCHMFCGWQIYSDRDALAHYGSGKFGIDILNQICQHNGLSIPPLIIVSVIRGWLLDDLNANHIPFESLKTVTLQVEIFLDPTVSVPYFGFDAPVDLRCTGRIVTDDTEYIANYDGKINLF
jgi:hypothetical protein